MGKPINSQPSDQTPMNNHFSHTHPLYLSDPQTLGHHIPPCSACHLDATVSGLVYTCVACNFVLHQKCYQLPEQIKHPIDQNHSLFLHPKPAYPEGLFNCDACGNYGRGFSYHCGPCGVDLHTTCAILPAELAHHSHHHHLRLNFSPPYQGNKFSCDVCKRMGEKTWIYRCSDCEFDVHITCVATVVPIPTSSVYGAASPVNSCGVREQAMMEAANSLASGIAQSTTDVLLQGLFGGGGGGGGGGAGDVSHVDVSAGMGEGGYGGGDGGYSGGDI